MYAKLLETALVVKVQISTALIHIHAIAVCYGRAYRFSSEHQSKKEWKAYVFAPEQVDSKISRIYECTCIVFLHL